MSQAMFELNELGARNGRETAERVLNAVANVDETGYLARNAIENTALNYLRERGFVTREVEWDTSGATYGAGRWRWSLTDFGRAYLAGESVPVPEPILGPDATATMEARRAELTTRRRAELAARREEELGAA